MLERVSFVRLGCHCCWLQIEVGRLLLGDGSCLCFCDVLGWVLVFVFWVGGG